jgi:hypothetical protein
VINSFSNAAELESVGRIINPKQNIPTGDTEHANNSVLSGILCLKLTDMQV